MYLKKLKIELKIMIIFVNRPVITVCKFKNIYMLNRYYITLIVSVQKTFNLELSASKIIHNSATNCHNFLSFMFFIVSHLYLSTVQKGIYEWSLMRCKNPTNTTITKQLWYACSMFHKKFINAGVMKSFMTWKLYCIPFQK